MGRMSINNKGILQTEGEREGNILKFKVKRNLNFEVSGIVSLPPTFPVESLAEDEELVMNIVVHEIENNYGHEVTLNPYGLN